MSSDGTSGTGRRSFLKYTTAASLGSIGLAGCLSSGGEGGSDDVVAIGSNHPLSGSLSYIGQPMSNAMELAADIKNEQGGIESLDGREVEIITSDNEGSQEVAAEAQQELIRDGAVVCQGSYSSPVTRSAVQVSARQGVPHVIDIAAAENVLQDIDQYGYRTSATAYTTGSDYADLVPELIRSQGETVDTAGLVYINNDFGQTSADGLKDNLPDADVEVVADTPYELGTSSLDTQVTRLREEDPDVVVATTYAEGGILLCETMQNLDYRPKFLTGCLSAAFSDDSAVGEIGQFANGIFGTNTSLHLGNDRTFDIIDQFEQRYDASMDGLVGMAFTTTELIMEAIEQAGSTDTEEIDAALRNINFEDDLVSAMPAINFDEDTGENQSALAAVQQVRDQDVTVVSPDEYAEMEADVCDNQC